MTNKSYPLFLPPNHLLAKSVKEWTFKEANVYFDLLLNSLDSRVDTFLEFLDVKSKGSFESLLRDVGIKLESILLQEQFHLNPPSEPNKILLRDSFIIEVVPEKVLSNQGYAIASDAGLLLAKCLLEIGNGKIFWTILKRPRRAESYNLPILEGFTSELHLDPIALSIAQASGVLRKSGKRDRWFNAYEYWKMKI